MYKIHIKRSRLGKNKITKKIKTSKIGRKKCKCGWCLKAFSVQNFLCKVLFTQQRKKTWVNHLIINFL